MRRGPHQADQRPGECCKLERVKLRLQTLALGMIPMLVLGSVLTLETIPGTDIRLTVPYAAEGPGPVYNTLGEIDGTEVIEITGADVAESTGSLSMTTVAVRSSMTFSQTLERWLVQGDTIIPREQLFPANTSEEEVQQANEQAFSQSEANATIAALQHLDLPIYTQVAAVQDDGAVADVLEEGDLITAVDDTKISEPTELTQTIQDHAPGDRVTLHYVRDDVDHEAEVTLGSDSTGDKTQLGVAVTASSGPGMEVKYRLKDVGGPSAGMIFSLAVIDKLSDGNLTGGKDVAGTGTIAEDGTVGPIGGIAHKIEAASAAGNELFLAPADNCAEAVQADAGDMVVAKVASLDDAIDQMRNYAAGDAVATCSEESAT